MSELRIGIIGLGAFGSRVAMRLLWSGFHTLQTYDTDEVTPRYFSNNYGGLNVGSPKMMAQGSDIIVTVLPSATELRDACFGWEGLAGGFQDGGIVLDLGVTDPVATVALARQLEPYGIQLVDAPAFGTPEDAREGKLSLLVGGADDAIERCRPILEKLAGKILRAGATGSAQAAGAIADYLRAARLLAASEAICLGAEFGFEPANLLKVCDALGGADLPEMLLREVATRRFKTGLSLGILHANVELAAQMASGAKLALPMVNATRDAMAKAEARLGYSVDHSAMIKWLESLSVAPADAAAGQAAKTEGGVAAGSTPPENAAPPSNRESA